MLPISPPLPIPPTPYKIHVLYYGSPEKQVGGNVLYAQWYITLIQHTAHFGTVLLNILFQQDTCEQVKFRKTGR